MLSVVTCPSCGGLVQLDQSAIIKESMIKIDDHNERKVELLDIKLNDISRSNDKIREVLAGIRLSIRNNVLIEDLVDQLRLEYGMARSYAMIIIERIKEFYLMYSPDDKHLCYI